MKKILKPFAMLLCIAPMGLTASCSSDDDEQATIVGKWMETRSVEGFSTSERSISTLKDVGYVDDDDNHYDFGGGRSTIQYTEYNTNDAAIYEFTADGYLTITWSDGDRSEYKYEMRNGGITVPL